MLDGDSTAASFLLVGSLFAVFAAPIFLRVHERSPRGEQFRMIDALRSWSQLRATIGHAQESPGLLRFIVGRFFYSDPVNTAIVVMSAFATQAIGFTSGEALNILLLLTVVAVHRVVRVGLALRPDRAQAHTAVGPRLMDRWAAARWAWCSTRSRSWSPAPCSAPGSGAWPSRIGSCCCAWRRRTRSARCSACTGWPGSSAP